MLGAPLGAALGVNGPQSGLESRISRFIVPLKSGGGLGVAHPPSCAKRELPTADNNANSAIATRLMADLHFVNSWADETTQGYAVKSHPRMRLWSHRRRRALQSSSATATETAETAAAKSAGTLEAPGAAEVVEPLLSHVAG